MVLELDLGLVVLKLSCVFESPAYVSYVLGPVGELEPLGLKDLLYIVFIYLYTIKI